MLHRNLGSLQVQLISIGGIIGSSYFLGIGSILKQAGGTTLLAFLLGGVIVSLVSLAMCELSVGMSREGSFVSQSRELLGSPWAAGVGWAYWFNWCAYIPSEMLAGGMILHEFFPSISILHWAMLFAAVITLINLLNVKYFGKIESLLALIKVMALVLFTVLGTGVWLGIVGDRANTLRLPQSLMGPLSYPTLDPTQSHLPGGAFAFLLTMVLVLVNFQGTELIALTAAETKNPEKDIPRASRNIALRIILLYVVPISLLLLIFPLDQVQVEKSAFVTALGHYGFQRSASVFQWIIITAALSCSNSGLYGAVRALYGLGKEGLAPAWVSKTNSQGVPLYATALTISVAWAFLPLYHFFENSNFYVWLLSVSGFTGALCWISITLCQIRFRKQGGKTQVKGNSGYQMPGFPGLSYLSLILQIICLGFLAFHPTLRTSIILGLPAFAGPALYVWARNWGSKNPGTPHQENPPQNSSLKESKDNLGISPALRP
ncbi:MAG: amino acid permease [Bdellovibrionia bacterium]